MAVLTNEDFEKWLKKNDKELYNGVTPCSLLLHTAPYFNTMVRNGNFLYVKTVATVMKDLYKLEQDYNDSLHNYTSL